MKKFYDFRCDACGTERTDVLAEYPHWPACACGAPMAPLWRANAVNVIGDEWPGGKTFENGFASPRTFYSPSEHRKALQENGYVVRGDGEEGHWSAMSKEGLRKAAELVNRVTTCQ